MGVTWRLVEREGEMGTLRLAMSSLSQGVGRFLVVQGPAGLGKTRLLQEAKRVAERVGLHVFSARGVELEQGFAFGVVRQLFEPVVRDPWDEVLAGSAAPASRVLGPVIPGQEPVGDLGSLHSLYWLAANLSHHRPLVLAVDDLHWADEASLRFFAYLLPRLKDLGVLVVVGLRPDEPGAYSALLDQVTTHPDCVVLPLSPLSFAASAHLLRQGLDGQADSEFLAACSVVTKGNPLLMWDLAGALRMQGVAPTAENASSVVELGGETVGRRVGLRLRRLPPDGAALARAVAVLGGEACIEQAASVAGITLESAQVAARDLRAVEILRLAGSEHHLAFVHPLVQAAVYSGLTYAERVQMHREAAKTLGEAGAEAEHVAAHLLRLPPEGNQWRVQILRRAGAEALSRGSPDGALRYLRRCLDEPPDRQTLTEVLVELGITASMVDLEAAADYLEQAAELETQLHQKAEIAYQLGRVWFYLKRFEEVLDLYREALCWVAQDADTDLQRRIQTGILQVQWLFTPRTQTGLTALVTQLREMRPQPQLGSRLLDGSIALYDATVLADPGAVARAGRAISDGTLVNSANGESGLVHAWLTLLKADRNEAMASLDAAVARAHLVGSTYALATALTFRGLGWLWRGELQEAEADLRTAMHATDAAQVAIARAHIGPYLANTLVEQGRVQEAAKILDWVDVPDSLSHFEVWFWFLESQALLLRAQGFHHQALEYALEAGRHAAAIDSPHFVSWRTHAALCLHTLNRTKEAREYAAEELDVARRWQAPRSLGLALRISGLIADSDHQLELLHEAVTVLRTSPARLEYAKALADLGATLRRRGFARKARPHLQEALSLAGALHAAPLAENIRAELHAAGTRPRGAVTGLQALTPSERRVVDMATAGQTNRDIAQQLFISIKTVEVHLTNAYRKLGITRRRELRQVLLIQKDE